MANDKRDRESAADKSADRSAYFEHVFDEYVDRINRGEPFDRQELFDVHPEIARDLVDQLELFEAIEGRPDSAASPLVTLGDYTLRREIGRGGMGVVYEAWENSMDRVVALKVLPPGVAADNRAFTRFLREAKTAGQLRHQNIVGVYSTGVKEGTPWYSMEYVHGETLAQVLARLRDAGPETDTPFGRKDEVRYFHNLADAFGDVADGLQHAHSRRIIHRDIKPSNLILDGEGKLRILDFGLAHLEGQESLTVSGDVVGTPLYMSPEQARSRQVKIDHRTDVYSLGATMYEALGGQPPFRGKDNADTLSQIIERDAVEPRKVNARVPKDLETIVLKCLRKDASDRYGTAEAMGQDLRRFVRGDPIEAQPQSAWEKWARRAWRHRARLLIGAMLGVILAISTVLALRLDDQARQKDNEAYDKTIASASIQLLRREWLLSEGSNRTAEQQLLLPRAHQQHFDRLGKDSAAAAEALLETAIRMVPGRPEAHYLLARCRMLRREISLAKAAALAALECDARFPLARCLLGVLEGQEVNLDGTIPWASVWQRAEAAMRGARWQEAVDAHGELLALARRERRELYPGASVESYFRRGIARLGATDYPRAVLDFHAARTLLESSGEKPLEALLFLGKALYLSGQPEAAAEAFDEAQRSSAKQDDTTLWIAGTYASVAEGYTRGGRHEDAVAAARAATRFRSDDPLVWVAVGLALLAQVDACRRQGDFDRNVSPVSSLLRDLDDASQKALGLGPESSVAHWFRAKALDALGDSDGSRRAYRRALELDTQTQGETDMKATTTAVIALVGAMAIGTHGGVFGQEGYFELEGPVVDSCVNFGGMQWGVSLSRDDQSLFYGAEGQFIDLYVASWDEDLEQFSSCRPLALLNSASWDTGSFASADGKTLYFESTRLAGGQFVHDIFEAHWDDTQDDYANPRVLPLSSGFSELTFRPSISTDGYELFFNVQKADWDGNMELWVAWRSTLDEPFTREHARPLSEVNSPHDEFGPVIHGDGKTLFWTGFLTDSHDGGANFQSSSIWIATRSESFDPTRHTEPPPFGSVRKLSMIPYTGVYNVAVRSTWPEDGSRIYFVSCLPSICSQGGSVWDIYSAIWRAAPTPGVGLSAEPAAGVGSIETCLTVEVTPPLDTSPVSIAFDFGDGSPRVEDAETRACHTYSRPGRFAATATATAALPAGETWTASASQTITVGCSTGDVAPWSRADIGEPAFPGSSRFEGEETSLSLCAGGRLLSGRSDELHFVYQEFEGDVVLSARVAEARGADDRWQVGLMLRESLDPGSRHSAVVLAKSPTSMRFRSITREAQDQSSRPSTGGDAAAPDAWVRIERHGNEIISSLSTDGATWEEFNRVAFDEALPATVLGGVIAIGNDSRPDSTFEPVQANVSNLEVSIGSEPIAGIFRRGDCTGDGSVDISDAVCILNRLFGGEAAAGCAAATNTNGDDAANITDATYLLSFLFAGGDAPLAPFPDCGPGTLPADETLGCASPPNCQ